MATTKVPVELSSTPGIVDNSNATAITIDSSERVGIGTTSPARQLHLVNSGNALMKLESTSASGYGGIDFANASRLWFAGVREDLGDGFGIKDETASAIRLAIDTSGQVGIGTTSPSKPLHIKTGDTTQAIQIENATGLDTFIGYESTYAFVVDTGAGGNAHLKLGQVSGSGSADIFFYTNGSIKQTITNDGKVGIGTDSPENYLHVYHATTNGLAHFESGDSSVNISFSDSATTAVNYNTIGAVGNELTFASNAAERMRIDDSGQVGIGTTSPGTKLHVNSGANSEILRVQGADAQLRIGNSTSNIIDINSSGSGDSLTLSTGDTERMRINSSGKVGIGETSPLGKLHIKDSDTGTSSANSVADLLVLEDTENGMSILSSTSGAGYILFGDSDSNAAGGLLYDHSANKLNFRTNDAWNRMILDSSGRLLIGTTGVYIDSTDKLVVSGGRIAATVASAQSGAFNRNTSTGDIIALLYNGSGKGSISTDGSNVAYNTSSDARLKNVLGDAKGLDIVNQLNPVHFEWKETGKTQDGLIAQEVEPLIPESVSTNEQTGFYEMDYSKLVTPLIKAVQEQQEQIEELKQQINKLRGN